MKPQYSQYLLSSNRLALEAGVVLVWDEGKPLVVEPSEPINPPNRSGPDAGWDEPKLDPIPVPLPIPNGSNRLPMAAKDRENRQKYKNTLNENWKGFFSVRILQQLCMKAYVLSLVWPHWLADWRIGLLSPLLSDHQRVQTGHWGGHYCWTQLSFPPLDETRR